MAAQKFSKISSNENSQNFFAKKKSPFHGDPPPPFLFSRKFSRKPLYYSMRFSKKKNLNRCTFINCNFNKSLNTYNCRNFFTKIWRGRSRSPCSGTFRWGEKILRKPLNEKNAKNGGDPHSACLSLPQPAPAGPSRHKKRSSSAKKPLVRYIFQKKCARGMRCFFE